MRLLLLFFMTSLILSCSKSDEMSPEDNAPNPLKDFMGDWVLDSVEWNGEFVTFTPQEMYITDRLEDSDNYGIMEVLYLETKNVDVYNLEVFDDDGRVVFGDGRITFDCFYLFEEGDRLSLTDVFPDDQVAVNTWRRK